ncbi:RNA-directed DNA polymerase, eukaryota, partial [Tanacetum coccineum]
WSWSLEGSGVFSVASVRKLLDDKRLPIVSSQTRWIKAVPIKVNILAWKVRLDCLPTRLNISRRGMDIASILCPICGSAVESSSHVFFDCQVTKDNFRKICHWWDVDFMEVFWARAKELFVWSPSFKDVPEKELFSDDESAKINEQANNLNNDEVENASEVVSDTYFGDNGEVQGFEQQHGESNDKEVSSDPFNIYNLLDKHTKEVRTTDTSTTIPYPPGFTPANDIPACNNQDIPKAESDSTIVGRQGGIRDSIGRGGKLVGQSLF